MGRRINDSGALRRVPDDQRSRRGPLLGQALYVCPRLGLGLDAAHARELLATATRSHACVAVGLVGLGGLEAEDPTPAEVTFGFARIAHEHRAIVTDGLEAVGHGRYRIDFASDLSHLL